MQPGHDGAERTLERARDLAIAELFDLGELEDAPLARMERGERGGQRGVVERARLGLGRRRVGRERDDARP
jgi:hypothetical protein